MSKLIYQSPIWSVVYRDDEGNIQWSGRAGDIICGMSEVVEKDKTEIKQLKNEINRLQTEAKEKDVEIGRLTNKIDAALSVIKKVIP